MHRFSALSFARGFKYLWVALWIALGLTLPPRLPAQDGSTTLDGVVEDATGARIASAVVTVANPENGMHRELAADATGNFSFGMLLPGRYVVSAWAKGMATQTASVELYVGGVQQVQLRLVPAGRTEIVTVSDQPETTETQSSGVSHVIPQQAIEN